MPADRRKNARLGLAIPVRVQGYRSDGSTWEEFSTTDDVSLGGSCFALAHEVELGQILLLTLALPRRLRQFDLTDASYKIYTLVRSVRRRPDQPRVGVMYFGKYPPRGFHDRPGARYLLPSDTPVGTPVPPGPPELPTFDGPPANPDAPAPAPPVAPPEPDDPDADTLPPATSEADPYPDPEPYPEPDDPPGLFKGPEDAEEPPTPPVPEPEDDREGLTRPVAAADLATGPPPARETPRVPNWGTEAVIEPRPGIPPVPPPDTPVVEFHPSREVPRERRTTPRVDLFVNFVIQLVDEWGAVLQEELTVADNVGRGGVRVMTTLPFGEGSVILLQEAGGGFATRAEVRGITQVQPGACRLHLRFIDREAPERLLRQ